MWEITLDWPNLMMLKLPLYGIGQHGILSPSTLLNMRRDGAEKMTTGLRLLALFMEDGQKSPLELGVLRWVWTATTAVEGDTHIPWLKHALQDSGRRWEELWQTLSTVGWVIAWKFLVKYYWRIRPWIHATSRRDILQIWGSKSPYQHSGSTDFIGLAY
jgi:hypothetical protein